jgi:hypothetical protein
MASPKPQCQFCPNQNSVVITEQAVEYYAVPMPGGEPDRPAPWRAVSYHCASCHHDGRIDLDPNYDLSMWEGPNACPAHGRTSNWGLPPSGP